MANKTRRRKRYFLGTGLQVRYLRLILIAIIVPALLFSACLYYLIFKLMSQQLAIPEFIYYNIVPVINKINLIILFVLPLTLGLILVWGIIISHRIAGPIYRLEKDLDKIAKGDFSVRIKFRKKDEISSIAEGINRILDKIEEGKRH